MGRGIDQAVPPEPAIRLSLVAHGGPQGIRRPGISRHTLLCLLRARAGGRPDPGEAVPVRDGVVRAEGACAFQADRTEVTVARSLPAFQGGLHLACTVRGLRHTAYAYYARSAGLEPE